METIGLVVVELAVWLGSLILLAALARLAASRRFAWTENEIVIGIAISLLVSTTLIGITGVGLKLHDVFGTALLTALSSLVLAVTSIALTAVLARGARR